MNSKVPLRFRVIHAMKRPSFLINHNPMLRLKLSIILFFLWPAAVFAADLGPSRQLANGEILRGRFSAEHPVKGFAKPMQSAGRFVVAPGRGLIWAVEKPMAMTFIFTDAGMVQTIGDMPLLQQSSQKMPFLAHVTGLLAAALGGDWKTLEPDFAITRSGSPKRWRVKMVPRPTCPISMPFRALSATGNSYVEQAEVLRPDGLSDTFVFRDHSITPAPLTNTEAKALALRPM
ncbi:MAG: hypothetical protein PHY92_04020 [Alphaproteobacteria bacterium]|nr:hypothetical protein [Alphaproteobacteria bacterium]